MVSTRICQRDGCEQDLDSLGLKATAKFCSRTCGREAGRQKGDGHPDQKWVPGKWVTVRPSRPRRRPRRLIPGVDLTSPVLAVLDAHKRAQGTPA